MTTQKRKIKRKWGTYAQLMTPGTLLPSQWALSEDTSELLMRTHDELTYSIVVLSGLAPSGNFINNTLSPTPQNASFNITGDAKIGTDIYLGGLSYSPGSTKIEAQRDELLIVNTSSSLTLSSNNITKLFGNQEIRLETGSASIIMDPFTGSVLSLPKFDDILTSPTSFREGSIYFDTFSKKLKFYNNTDWITLGPSLTGNAGKVLTVNPGETDTIWATPSGGSSGIDNSTNVQIGADFNIDGSGVIGTTLQIGPVPSPQDFRLHIGDSLVDRFGYSNVVGQLSALTSIAGSPITSTISTINSDILIYALNDNIILDCTSGAVFMNAQHLAIPQLDYEPSTDIRPGSIYYNVDSTPGPYYQKVRIYDGTTWSDLGGGGGISGSGTINRLPVFTGATSVGSSSITDTGSIVSLNSSALKILNFSTEVFAVDQTGLTTIKDSLDPTNRFATFGFSGGNLMSLISNRGILIKSQNGYQFNFDTDTGFDFKLTGTSFMTVFGSGSGASNGLILGGQPNMNPYLQIHDTSIVPTSITNDNRSNIFMKNGSLYIQYQDGVTIRYKYLDLTGTGVTWQHTTVSP